jgi:hypothetical protein
VNLQNDVRQEPMLAHTGSALKRPALSRRLQVFHMRTNTAPLAISAALVMLVAAAPVRLHLLDVGYAKQHEAPIGSHAQAYSRLGARIAVQPNDVVKDGVVIGRDPDPFIRAEMLRHYGVGGP